MEQYNRCMGCMEVKGEARKCPHCGWIEGTMPEFPFCLPPGTILNDKYLIGRVLGQGGYGITYLALELNLNQKLAIKEYFPQDMASRTSGLNKVSMLTGSQGNQYEYGMDKFLQEARTLAKFNEHPNIVLVRDYFKANGTAYFVMSYVEGITLKSYLARSGGKLPVNKALRVIVPVMNALKEVHAADVLHRDISPDNIFINRNGQVVLLDFGASRQTIGEKGRTLSIILKPDYAPEEQYRTKGLQGPWTDIYAVAATFYHLITGKKPPEALERLVKDNLIPPSQLGINLGPQREQALLKALSVLAKERYHTVKEFQDALMVTGPPRAEVSSGVTTGNYDRFEEAHEKQMYNSVNNSFSGPSGEVPHYLQAMSLSDFYKGSRSGSQKTSLSTGEPSVTGEYPGQTAPRAPAPEFSGEQRKQNYILGVVIVFAAIALLFTAGQFMFRSPGGPFGGGTREIEGGTILGHMVGRGYAVQSGDWIYFSNSADGDRLYRINLDGTGYVQLNNDPSMDINILGNWIFYTNGNDERRVYKIRTDGTERTRITLDKAMYITVDEEWIYFSNRDDNGTMYRARHDGSQRAYVNSDNSGDLNAVDGWIYYWNADDGGKIYKIRSDGTGRTRINNDYSRGVRVAGDWIYYRNGHDGGKIYKIRTDGTERTKLNDDSSSSLNVVGDWIYYINYSDGGRLYRIRTDGTERQPA